VSRPPAPAGAPPTRDWCATAFVVWEGRILLHHHAKLQRWLPPGGHVELDELPDDAAVREVLEETGVHVELLGERAIDAPGPGSSCGRAASSSRGSRPATSTWT